MSKSSGNFLTLYDVVQRFSANGISLSINYNNNWQSNYTVTRFTLADAGDTLQILYLKWQTLGYYGCIVYTLIEWAKVRIIVINLSVGGGL